MASSPVKQPISSAQPSGLQAVPPIRRGAQLGAAPSIHFIPAPLAQTMEVRFRTLAERASADPLHPDADWQAPVALAAAPIPGFFQLDINALNLPDGLYEYELLVDGRAVPDPFAEEITKFGGYRSLIRIVDGVRVSTPFSWDNELAQGANLPNNNQIVMYELPVHWMSGDMTRQVGLGTFEKMVFEHLQDLRDLGINAIELLPIEDSSDTLNWGYGTRFFFAPDWDMGSAVDMKFLVKCCHRLGMRVILDIVMNHSRECPLESLATDWYYLRDDANGNPIEDPDRPRWGGKAFRYANPVNGAFLAREFQCGMGEFWVREYHVDGFRIDEFKGINNWDFIQEFRERTWAEHNRLFDGRPFTVIAEDSWRRPEITDPHAYNDKPLVDASWNFDYRDELRRLLSHTMNAQWGQPSRSDRIQNMVSAHQVWDDWNHTYRAHGFTDLAQAVNYVTSHDVADFNGQRLMNFFFGQLLQYRGLANYPQPSDHDVVRKGIHIIKRLTRDITSQSSDIQATHADALERAGSAFALMLTSVGIPMFLAGEEFGDIHDLDYLEFNRKMTDPVDFTRCEIFGHRTLMNRVAALVALRTTQPALQRNEVTFFYFHPTIDNNDGVKVFGYCRTNGQPLGTGGQVIVLANCGPDNFPIFDFPSPWQDGAALREYGAPLGAMNPQITNRNGSTALTVSLAPFQVRVFTT